MPRFDVYPAPGGEGLAIDVQADLLAQLNTRVVVPLMPVESAPVPAKTLNPRFEVDGRAYIMVTQYLAAVPRRLLGKPVASLSRQRDDIVSALDLLFQGF